MTTIINFLEVYQSDHLYTVSNPVLKSIYRKLFWYNNQRRNGGRVHELLTQKLKPPKLYLVVIIWFSIKDRNKLYLALSLKSFNKF